MKPTDLSIRLTHFLSHYIAGKRNLSPNTVKAYRDTFILLLQFCRDVKGIPLEKLRLEHIDVTLVEAFLDHLEKQRHCKVCTLNHRLATLHAFFRYLQAESPEHLLLCQKILSIPLRRFVRKTVEYLSKEHLTALLAQPDLTTQEGRRDAVLLSVLYDTGARVQELIDLSVGDLRLTEPAQVRILGKGRKIRTVPLMQSTVQLLQDYLQEHHLETPDKLAHPLFQNHHGKRLSRSGVRYIFQKYVQQVRQQHPEFNQSISPHSMRHTKGMHLLQGGVSLDIIRDFLGHVDIKTTEIYAR
ncbi:MAG: tyrosine-type recombinase/integrase, partial [Aliifodinibius sp.]|nr:tyrosine-type recombinase/integrase [Fodinibius sp.]NIV13019.1 tyrosine-type recombinase/integrase [Fodinibius sp.]NIY26684.1 tyrosine-type recombinase/integrase [Fodinibius sp.]